MVYKEGLTPEEVLKKAERLGVRSSRSTLLRFEKEGWIPKARRGSNGRGQGGYAEYPQETPVFFFAAWKIFKSRKYPKEKIIQGLVFYRHILSQEKNDPNADSPMIRDEKEFLYLRRFYELDNENPKNIWDEMVKCEDDWEKVKNTDDYPNDDEEFSIFCGIGGAWETAVIEGLLGSNLSLTELLKKVTELKYDNLALTSKIELQEFILSEKNKEIIKLKKILKSHGTNPT